MRTRYWCALFAGLTVLCLGACSFLFRPREAAAFAEIYQDGALLRTVALGVDQNFTVHGKNGGSNTITVRDGKIAVTEASCPDHYCVARGWCNQGTQIICLPNGLMIAFSGGAPQVDSIVG